jgi:O-antigen/teichoic acid export membrane protein
MLKKLFSHSILYALGPQVPRLANIILLPIITKYLTSLDYGVYGTIMAYNGLLMGVKSLGFDVLLVNAFFKKENRWQLYWKRYSGILYIWQHLYIFIYILILYLIIPKEASNNKLLLILLIIVPNYLFSIVNTLGGRYFQIAQKPQRIFITTALSGTITIVTNYYCIVTLQLGYLGWYISAAAGTFVMFCSYVWPIWVQLKIRPIFNLKKAFVKKALKIALPTIPHQYSTYLLNSSDRLVMDQLNVSINNIGNYNMAYIIGNYFKIFGDAVIMAVAPYYTQLHSRENIQSDYQIRTLVYFLQVIFLMLAFIISLWAKEIFHFLISNDELEKVYYIAIIIIMGYTYRPMYSGAMSKIFYLEKTNKLWLVSFIGGAINIILNFIFIPIYGFEVAAITTFISLMYLGFAGYFLKEYRTSARVKFYPLLWLIVITISTITVYIIKDIDIMYKLMVTLFICLLFILYFFKNKKKLTNIII